jgi:UDP-glucose 4-epimerase
MKILVTGAAGYIGSVVTELLIEQGNDVVALDNLSHGHRDAIHPQAEFINCDLLEGEQLERIFNNHAFDAVVHLAAEALIDESLRDPGRFFKANISGGINLLEAMASSGVKKIVFSSTAAVYGEPQEIPIRENSSQSPVNSYGESKLAFERILAWYQIAYGIHHISLRYFNACGATKMFGEFHVPETHLIPIVFDVALGERKAIHLFGTDYDTPDGSCIRDYIHVVDIARAHILALAKIDDIKSDAFNMGNGNGYSNREVIQTIQDVIGKKVAVIEADRRPGDPARLLASSDRVRQELGWEPLYPDLRSMIQTAWDWRLAHPKGYSK